MKQTRIITAVIALALAPLPARAERTVHRHDIAPGVELVQTILDASEPQGPALIHALIVDPRSPGLRLEAALGNDTVEDPAGGREPIQRQVARTGALAGINADFFSFNNGDPLGLHIHKGEPVSEILPGRAALGLRRDGTALIGIPVFRGTVAAANGPEMVLGGLNRAPGANELIAYTSIYGTTTAANPLTFALLRLQGERLPVNGTLDAKVVSVTETQAVTIPGGHIALAGRGAAADWLKENALGDTTMRFSMELKEAGRDWTEVQEAVAGGPMLLRAGQVHIDYETAGHAASFSTTRHPRTAVGISKDGKIILAVADGRQVLSRGMSLPEMAAAMKDLGAEDAVNLDGGGSSALSVRGLVINSPSDGTVRRVSNSLLLFRDVPAPAERASSTAMAPEASVIAGESPLSLPGPEADLARNGKWTWGTDDGKAFVDQEGRVYGYKAGKATVIALAGKEESRREWPVTVVPGPPARLTLAWKDGKLGVLLTDRNANGLAGREVTLTRADAVTVTVTTGADGRVNAPEGWLASEKDAVTARHGDLVRSLPEVAVPVPPTAPTAARVTP